MDQWFDYPYLCQPLAQFLLLLTVATMPCSAHFHIYALSSGRNFCLGPFFFSIGAYQLCVSPPPWQKQWRLKLLWKSAFPFNIDRQPCCSSHSLKCKGGIVVKRKVNYLWVTLAQKITYQHFDWMLHFCYFDSLYPNIVIMSIRRYINYEWQL